MLQLGEGEHSWGRLGAVGEVSLGITAPVHPLK